MNIFKSVLTYRCPRCRQTSLFKKPFEMSKPLEMNHSCEVCGLRFEPEPGFYYGAMFVSYLFSGWFFIAVSLTLVFVVGWSLEAAMLVVVLLAAAMFFKLLRTSRSVWIHFVVKYNPSYIDKKTMSESKNP